MTAPLTNGVKFGLGMAINDGDNGPGQAGQKGWGGLGAHAIVHGKTPSETALVTLGGAVSGTDRLFLSAVNPGVASFTFRATDKGTSIVDPASAKLTIDDKVVTLTSKKTVDATDFTYTPAAPFASGTTHTYAVEVKDTQGNLVKDQGTFKPTAIKIGLSFGADQPNTADPVGSALLATDVAGVPAVAQANWNNLSNPISPVDADGNSTPVPVLTDAGASTSVTVSWESNNTWASTGLGEENNKFTGPDATLMTGYLDTDAATTSHVTIQGIPEALTAGGYDVYVYLLGGAGAKGGGYRIVDSTGAVLKGYVLATAMTNPTGYKEVVQGGARAEGNYIVFKGLKAASITVEATTTAPQGSGTNPRAPINAIQLVPSTALPGGLTVSAKRTAAGIEITYQGTLQASDTINGTFTNVAGASSPYTTQTGGTAKFFRAQQ